MQDRYPYYLAGEPVQTDSTLDVRDKYSGDVATTVSLADAAALDSAIGAAVEAAPAMAALPTFQRKRVLDHCVARFRERAEELAEILCVEAGKAIRDARGEVCRLVETFEIASDEVTRASGEVMPLDLSERTSGYVGMFKRVPVGPCAFVSPFNFPLNLVAHKVAPAIAAGCPFVLKPASLTPVGGLVIAGVLAETDLPRGAFSVLPCSREEADSLCTDERIKLLSFTGSPGVGWALKSRAGKKAVVLELGGNAAVIVDEDADLEDAVERVVFGAYYQSGQSCISVQRVFVHDSIYVTFRERMVAAVRNLKKGNPHDEDTSIGPMISEGEAARLEGWIKSALDNGARLLCGGGRDATLMEATLLEEVDPGDDLSRREAFGPVALLVRFSDFDQALDRVNDSAYGLQTGVFTNDIHKAHRAWDRLEVGGVIIGDVPSWRADNMPYGGVKDSGLGREGVRFAVEHMTELRMLVIRRR
ncbi:MAG: aldehyde dehydrogenase family protein [Candidatus Binatia bacterium]